MSRTIKSTKRTNKLKKIKEVKGKYRKNLTDSDAFAHQKRIYSSSALSNLYDPLPRT